MAWKIIGRHKWVSGARITESVNQDDDSSRFTATIRGFRNWKLYQGRPSEEVLRLIIRVVRAIRDQIDGQGEEAEVFLATNEYSLDVDGLRRMMYIFENLISLAFDDYLDEIQDRISLKETQCPPSS